MTTITIEESVSWLSGEKFLTVADLLQRLLYEEQLEKKLQKAKKEEKFVDF